MPRPPTSPPAHRRRGRLWALLAAATLSGFAGLAGCHLALGLETAETVDSSSLCESDGDCNDNNPCTDDSCTGSCVFAPLSGVDAPDSEQTAGDCLRVACFSGSAMSEPDDADVPDDGNECTTQSCSGGTVVTNDVTGGTPCTQGGGVVCSGGECVECHSNMDCSLPETCGGGGTANECGCTPMQNCTTAGLTCGFLPDMTCGGTIPCNNSMQDGGETDVDCGGPVNTCSLRCGDGAMCMINSDCASNNCDNGTCAP